MTTTTSSKARLARAGDAGVLKMHPQTRKLVAMRPGDELRIPLVAEGIDATRRLLQARLRTAKRRTGYGYLTYTDAGRLYVTCTHPQAEKARA
jgi:hypothetical protein